MGVLFRQGPRSVSEVIWILASDTVFVQLNQYPQIPRRQCCLVLLTHGHIRAPHKALQILQKKKEIRNKQQFVNFGKKNPQGQQFANYKLGS